MRTDRLLTLARHLESGKLGHKIFDFDVYNVDDEGSSDDICGTRGCAIGECPILWPKDWRFSYHNGVVLIEGGTKRHIFFDITENEYRDLFIPNLNLDRFSTKEDVAMAIYIFIEFKERKKI